MLQQSFAGGCRATAQGITADHEGIHCNPNRCKVFDASTGEQVTDLPDHRPDTPINTTTSHMTRLIVKLAADARLTANDPMGISHDTVGAVEDMLHAFTQLLNTGVDQNELVALIAELDGIGQDSCRVLLMAGLVHTIQ